MDNPYMFHSKYVACTEPFVYSRFFRDYMPNLGRWMQMDPISYKDSMNLYEFVRSNSINYIDPWGLYEEEWEGKWSPEEKKRFHDSMERMKNRFIELNKQIDDELKDLPKGKCYDKIRKELNNLKKMLNKVNNGIMSKEENLELYQHKFKKNDDAMARTILPFVFLDNEIHFDTRDSSDWHFFTDDKLDSIFFHELTHLYGTEDDDSKGEFMNAHILDDLLSGNLTNNIFLRYWKMECRKRCPQQQNDPNAIKESNNVQ